MNTKAEIIKLYKNIGETPLECLKRFKESNPEYKETKMTYLGRLDPMAEGVLLVLAGNMRDKKKYLEMDKTYEFEVLWSFATDTYDILGEVTDEGVFPKKLDFKMEGLLEKIQSKKSQEYPPYSSKTVGGAALFTWARENKINEIDLPSRGIKIFSIEHIHTKLITGIELLTDILGRINLVQGDFRQNKIKEKWQEVLGERKEEQFLISRFIASVSSGTYIRSLANEMGELLNTKALAFNIKRTRVGEYKI